MNHLRGKNQPFKFNNHNNNNIHNHNNNNIRILRSNHPSKQPNNKLKQNQQPHHNNKAKCSNNQIQMKRRIIKKMRKDLQNLRMNMIKQLMFLIMLRKFNSFKVVSITKTKIILCSLRRVLRETRQIHRDRDRDRKPTLNVNMI